MNGKKQKKVFNTSIKRFWGFIKLGRGKFKIRKAGREILAKDFRGRSFTKFLVLQKTSKLYFLIISIYISYTLLK